MCKKAKNQTGDCLCFLFPIDGTNSLPRLLSVERVRSSRIEVFKNTGIFALFFCSFWVWNLDQESSRLRKCLKPLECGTAAKSSHARKTQAVQRATSPRARRQRREVYFCLRMVKCKIGTILENYREGIGELRRKENETWGFQVRWRSLGQPKRNDCTLSRESSGLSSAASAPLGWSDSSMFPCRGDPQRFCKAARGN